MLGAGRNLSILIDSQTAIKVLYLVGNAGISWTVWTTRSKLPSSELSVIET